LSIEERDAGGASSPTAHAGENGYVLLAPGTDREQARGMIYESMAPGDVLRRFNPKPRNTHTTQRFPILNTFLNALAMFFNA